MVDKNEKIDDEAIKKPNPNKLVFILLGFLALICIAMAASFVMLIKMQANIPQLEAVPDLSKAQVQGKDAVAGATKSQSESKEVKVSAAPSNPDKEKNEQDHPKPQYYKMRPAIVVNIPGVDKVRFLQVDVELMTRNSSGVESIEAYAPLIRNDLIILFSTQKYDDLVTVEGKEELRKKALEIVQRVMKQYTGDGVVEQVLFTNFVSQ